MRKLAKLSRKNRLKAIRKYWPLTGNPEGCICRMGELMPTPGCPVHPTPESYYAPDAFKEKPLYSETRRCPHGIWLDIDCQPCGRPITKRA